MDGAPGVRLPSIFYANAPPAQRVIRLWHQAFGSVFAESLLILAAHLLDTDCSHGCMDYHASSATVSPLSSEAVGPRHPPLAVMKLDGLG